MSRSPPSSKRYEPKALEAKIKGKRLDTVAEPHHKVSSLEESVILKEAGILLVCDYFERYMLT
jgi:hypothetical protein